MKGTNTDPDHGEVIGLDLNENLVLDEDYYRAVGDVDCDLSCYPEEGCTELREGLADLHDVRAEQVVVDCGSYAVLDTIFKALVPTQGTLGNFVPSYSFYDLFADRNDVKVLEVPLASDFTLPADIDFARDIDLLVICSPNNPTGLTVEKKRIKRLLEANISLVIDEAYVEYSDQELVGLLKENDNLVLVRTFSKAWGLAGIRLGYALTSASTAMELRDIKLPYSLSSHTLEVAKDALKKRKMVEESVEKTIDQRERMLMDLDSLGFNTLPTQTNFITCRPPADMGPDELRQELLDRGFRIKVLEHPRLMDHVRITVGDERTNDLLLEELRNIF